MTVVPSSVSLALNPSPLKVVLVLLWLIVAGSGWLGYGKLKAEGDQVGRQE